ncbi:hypothetical protein EVAR_86519_1 [Eumeta japonica]|uniref:Uncharacterized protein n=1 Tax=Eumeta variegata TaxID=151549 RepID=A0A4C1VNW4_EUMVA|nr:hypothetical protein EVAR_86519_1 [Eumeta japonica]
MRGHKLLNPAPLRRQALNKHVSAARPARPVRHDSGAYSAAITARVGGGRAVIVSRRLTPMPSVAVNFIKSLLTGHATRATVAPEPPGTRPI